MGDDLGLVAIEPEVRIALEVWLPVNGLGRWRRELVERKAQMISKALRKIGAYLPQILALGAYG